MDILVFDIRADFGHFRKYYSTSSPLTYSIIPPTAMYGILGAILGLTKEENGYLKILNERTVKFGLQILTPVKKMRMGINYVNTKGNVWLPKQRREGARTQIRVEFLKNPSYRCYVHLKDELLFRQLTEYIRQHKSVYTVSLGLSECLADIVYVDRYSVNECQSVKEACIDTVLSNELVEGKGIKIEEGKSYMKERVPTAMNEERIVSKYEEMLFEPEGKPITASVKRCYQTEQGQYITFLNE